MHGGQEKGKDEVIDSLAPFTQHHPISIYQDGKLVKRSGISMCILGIGCVFGCPPSDIAFC